MAPESPLPSVDWAEALGRLHPVLLHLPIGLLIALVFVELARAVRRHTEPDATRGALVLLLALSAPLSAGTGWLLRESGGYGPSAEWHQYSGIALAVLAVLTGLACWRRSRAYPWLLGLGFVTLLPTAHLGAELTHGEGYLLEPWRRAAEPVMPRAPRTEQRQVAGPVPVARALGAKPPGDELSEAIDAYAAAAPFFQTYCTRCHGASKHKADLSLHALDSVLAGSANGPVVVPGSPETSRLLQVLRLPLEHDEHMPPEGKRQPTAAQVDAVAEWVRALADPAGRALAPIEVDAATPPAAEREPEPALDSETSARAVRALRERLVHVEPEALGSPRLRLDFTAVENVSGRLAEWTAELREVVVDVNLSGQELAAADVEYLGTLPRLERLDLRRLRGAAPDLAPLARSSALRVLNLAGTQLADETWLAVREIATLVKLFLWNTGASPAAVEDLASARPELVLIGASEPPAAPLETEPEVVFERPAGPLPAGPSNAACPVSGEPIDARFTILHEGRAIGFCCAECPATFWEDPAAY